MDKDAEIARLKALCKRYKAAARTSAPMREAMEATEGQWERCDASLASHFLLINEINYIISDNGIYSLLHLHTVATAASSYSRHCGIFIQSPSLRHLHTDCTSAVEVGRRRLVTSAVTGSPV